MNRLRRSLVLACCLAASCGPSPTELVVIVDTDLGVPGELDEVRVTVTGPSGMANEAAQHLDEPGSPTLPLTLGVSPSGEALGPIHVVAEGRLAGAVEVTRSATTTLVRGESHVLYLVLERDCASVTCGDGETCDGGQCTSDAVDAADLPRWTGQIPGRDGGIDSGVRPDAGPMVCTRGADCDDGVDCTMDVCADGACTHNPDDGACTAASGGTCDPVDGCQYDTCTAETCTAGPCQTAACDGNRCVRTSLCATGESCCAGACVPAGCSDANPCTDDTCGAAGCEHANNTASCDDGQFCTGPDTCADGACAVHGGSPCAGSAVCDEATDVCTGCISDADCGAPVRGEWGECGGFSDTCAQAGTRSRSVTSYTCMSGACVGSTSTESESCTRSTDGTSCGSTSCDSWGSCGGFADACDDSGTKSRTCTDYTCSGGTCATSTRTESTGCTRSTDGTSCGSTSCDSWGSCGGFSGTCDESGTKSRTCTDYTCGGGTCNGATRNDTSSCSRSTTGTTCMPTSCDAYGACGGFSGACDESGTKTRTCTDYTCGGGTCNGAPRDDTASCTRDSDGSICDDGDSCTRLDRCYGGFCEPGIDRCCGSGGEICP